MSKVCEVVKTTAIIDFKKRKQEIIKQIIHKNYKNKPNFQEVLNLYIK